MERTEVVLTSVEAGVPAVLLRRPVVAPVLSNPTKPVRRSSKPGWQILASALLIGVVGGVVVGLLGIGNAAPKIDSHNAGAETVAFSRPAPERAEVLDAPTASVPANSEELSRLKARNRRLEALISVLRERKDAHAKPRVAPR